MKKTLTALSLALLAVTAAQAQEKVLNLTRPAITRPMSACTRISPSRPASRSTGSKARKTN
jgi:hypothetical protein